MAQFLQNHIKINKIKNEINSYLLFFSYNFFLVCHNKKTIADGSWFNPAVWSPVGVPLMEDTVMIDHDITVSSDYVDFGANWLIVNSNASIICDTIFALHGNLKVYGLMDVKNFAVGDGTTTLVYGIVAGGKYTPGNPNNFNYGTISTDTLVVGDSFDNYGLIDIMDLIIGSPPFINHSSAAVVISGQYTGGAASINEVNATIVAASFFTGDDMTNNGDVTTVAWTHGSGTVTGTTGKFCISDCFMNTGDITGTVDICDATPGGFCDFDFGTIAGTVTYCSSSPCGSNVSIEENSSELSIYPNPVHTTLSIQNAAAGNTWQLIDLNGNLVETGIITSASFQLTLEHLETGIYFLKVQNDEDVFVSKVIKN